MHVGVLHPPLSHPFAHKSKEIESLLDEDMSEYCCVQNKHKICTPNSRNYNVKHNFVHDLISQQQIFIGNIFFLCRNRSMQ